MFQEQLQSLYGQLILFAPKIAMALVVLIIGLWVIKMVVKGIRTAMTAKEFDPTVQRFLTNLIDVVLKIMLIMSAASMVGIATTSFLAILTSAGLAIGLALQGGLSNFAGGVLLLIFKPFKVGERIEAQGFVGSVQEISIFVTRILTDEGKTVFIPNGPLANGPITNVTSNGFMRVDTMVLVPYGSDMEKVKQVILAELAKSDAILKDPAPTVNVLELADGFMKVAVRPYATQPQYWDAYFYTTEAVRHALDSIGVEPPVPARIVINQ